MAKKKKKDFDPSLCQHDTGPSPWDKFIAWFWSKRETHHHVACENCGFYKCWEKKK